MVLKERFRVESDGSPASLVLGVIKGVSLKWFAPFFVSFLIGCAGFPQAVLADRPKGWSRTNADEIRLDGEITSMSLSEFWAVSEGGFKRVVLNSPGGMEYAAMRIAQDRRYGAADIVVEEQCASACANFLALLGRSLTVKCDSILTLHGTIIANKSVSSIFRSVDNFNFLRKFDKRYDIQSVKNWYANTDLETRALFHERKIDIDILFFSNPEFRKSFLEFSFDADTGQIDLSVSQNGIWMPSLMQLKAYGLRNLNYCAPANDEEFRGRVERIAKHPERLQDYVFHVGP